jgi:hypothetical protein
MKQLRDIDLDQIADEAEASSAAYCPENVVRAEKDKMAKLLWQRLGAN